MELNEIAKEESERLIGILHDYGVNERRIAALNDIITNTAWMKAKLDDTREAIKSSGVVIPYDNGGGQKGLRESPLYKGYESLWKSYMAGMDRILNALPPEIPVEAKAEEPERPKTVLELVRAKREAK